MFNFFKKKPLPSAADVIARKIESIYQKVDNGNGQRSDLIYQAVFGPALKLYEGLDEEGVLALPSGYKSDGFIFEFIAYLLFRADVYLFTEYPEQRQMVIQNIYEQAAATFSQSLDVSNDDIHDMLGHRMNYYAPLVQNGSEPREVHNLIMLAVHSTAQNSGMPKTKIEVVPASALDEFQIKMLLPDWELHFVKHLHSLFDSIYG
jgi:hypothetical protein